MEKETILYVMNILRKGTVTSPQRREALRKARKKVLIGKTKQGKDKFKLHWQCAKCLEWSENVNSFEVDHKVEIGGFKGDWNSIIDSMYCDASQLQVLCISCHAKKTAAYNSVTRYERKQK